MTLAPLAVAVEIRALDVGPRLVRAFRMSESIGEDSVRLVHDLPFEPGRPVIAALTLPGDAAAVHLTGVVAAVRAEGEDEDPRPRSIAFGHVDPATRHRLERYVTERTLNP